MGIRHSLTTEHGANGRPEIAVSLRNIPRPNHSAMPDGHTTNIYAAWCCPLRIIGKCQPASVEDDDMITGHVQFRQ